MLDFRSAAGGTLGGFLGGLTGLAVGALIKVPSEYDASDSDAVRIIEENSLLQIDRNK